MKPGSIFMQEAHAAFKADLAKLRAEEKKCIGCKTIRKNTDKNSLDPRICEVHQMVRRALAFQEWTWDD